MDAWFESGSLSRNEIAFHGCPYSSSSSSWVDFGNETPYTPCDGVSVTIGMPKVSYFNLNILDVAVGGVSVSLYSGWQQSMYSILDSCTSMILVPTAALAMLQSDIIYSGGLSNRLQNSPDLQNWLDANVMLGLAESDIQWEMLPNISFTIDSTYTNSYSNITLVLGPRQYIQKESNGYCMFGGLSCC